MASWFVVLIINGNLYVGEILYATKAECEQELVQAQMLISHAGECRASPSPAKPRDGRLPRRGAQTSWSDKKAPRVTAFLPPG